MQERKRVPTVKIQEYMDKDSNDSCGDDSNYNSQESDTRNYKVKTHHVIEDFGCLHFYDAKHIGLEEVSPLEERHTHTEQKAPQKSDSGKDESSDTSFHNHELHGKKDCLIHELQEKICQLEKQENDKMNRL